ncbi:DUF1565 domain-containing protein [Kineosporia sp. J2-2]|uniref:DUF1565 domain-containing protein n=1 Tax=Kineosporia corallincola TaxID=2835133 RepID=A0ABS5TMC0_9ACTN|nr:DUF1565 domain-containing protein [Kineosporia corallincola]MBT0772249.1 DUF1565 domain-containing protein [Kineosporia corallincola]
MLTRRNHRPLVLGISVASAAVASVAVSAALSAPPSHADSPPPGRVLYVSPEGSDGTTRMAAGRHSPLATITKAIKLAQPGDTIVVQGGTYVGAAGYGASPGRADAPIRLQNAPGERVVIKGTLQLENADYWRVSGIDVTRNPADGRKEFLVKFDGGTGWAFVNSEVWGSVGVSNVMVSASKKNGVPKNYRIADNCIHDNNADGDAFMNYHNIYLMPGYRSGPGVIERNVMFNAENGAAVKAAGPTSATGAGDVTIRRNTITRVAAGVIIGYASRGVQVRNNLIAQQRIEPPAGAQWVKNYDAAVIGNHVTGSGNKVVSTALSGFPRLVNNTHDSSRPVKGALTQRITPKFSGKVSCNGFRTVGAASRYGRWS